MKKIGREVLLIEDTPTSPRNGEGAFFRLRDGRILYAFTKFYTADKTDSGSARIAAVYSSDEGESWSEESVLFEKPEGALNIMSVSLMRMQNGDLGLIYLRKEKHGDATICYPVLHRSPDEGAHFDAGLPMTPATGYYVLNNDRVIRLQSGRMIFAVANHRALPGGRGLIEVFYSDDDGKTFQKAPGCALSSPIKDRSLGFYEPGLYELPDGRIWLYIRTPYGFQYQSFSTDGGENWTDAAPNYMLTSPSSPMLVKTVGAYTVAVFNPMPVSELWTNVKHWFPHPLTRTPLVAAVSVNGGLSLADQDLTVARGDFLPHVERCYFVEDDFDESYCYPAMMEVSDGFLVAYYFSNGKGSNLRAARITKINFSELA